MIPISRPVRSANVEALSLIATTAPFGLPLTAKGITQVRSGSSLSSADLPSASTKAGLQTNGSSTHAERICEGNGLSCMLTLRPGSPLPEAATHMRWPPDMTKVAALWPPSASTIDLVASARCLPPEVVISDSCRMIARDRLKADVVKASERSASRRRSICLLSERISSLRLLNRRDSSGSSCKETSSSGGPSLRSSRWSLAPTRTLTSRLVNPNANGALLISARRS